MGVIDSTHDGSGRSLSSFEDNRVSIMNGLDKFLELEKDSKPQVSSSTDFFKDMISSSRFELSKERPDVFEEASAEKDGFLAGVMVLFINRNYETNASMVSKYFSDHLIAQQERKKPLVEQYVDFRVSGEWITFFYGFYGNPANTLLKNTARQKGDKKLSFLGSMLTEEEGKAKLMDDSDFIKNGKMFFKTAADIAEHIPYKHPENVVIRELSHTLDKEAVVLQRARINYCSANCKVSGSDLDNLAGNF